MAPVRTLHIDIEGGWGGSSRSLFELVSRLDRERVAPLVVHRQSGPVEQWYGDIAVPRERVPEIGTFVPRETKAAKNFVASLPRLARNRRAAARIAAVAQAHGAQVIHLNYEGLFLLGRRLKAMLGLPIIAHSRALLPMNHWARWLARSLAATADHMLFISPQEGQRFQDLVGPLAPRGTVLWNIAPPAPPRRPLGDPPIAVYFGSLDHSKGTDRLIDVAAALEAAGAPPLKIEIYGKARTHSRFEADLVARIAAERLSHRVTLMGHTADPMAIMAGALALIRPSRGNDPWGRDVIEAAASGLPALATGQFDGVVEPGRTGYLFDPFNAGAMAAHLVAIVQSPDLWGSLSAAARIRAVERFDGRSQVARFTSIVEDLAGAGGSLA